MHVRAALRPRREAVHLLLRPGGEEAVELPRGERAHRGLRRVVGEQEEGVHRGGDVAGALRLVPAVALVGAQEGRRGVPPGRGRRGARGAGLARLDAQGGEAARQADGALVLGLAERPGRAHRLLPRRRDVGGGFGAQARQQGGGEDPRVLQGDALQVEEQPLAGHALPAAGTGVEGGGGPARGVVAGRPAVGGERRGRERAVAEPLLVEPGDAALEAAELIERQLEVEDAERGEAAVRGVPDRGRAGRTGAGGQAELRARPAVHERRTSGQRVTQERRGGRGEDSGAGGG